MQFTWVSSRQAAAGGLVAASGFGAHSGGRSIIRISLSEWNGHQLVMVRILHQVLKMHDPRKLSYNLLDAILWFNYLHDLVFLRLNSFTLFPLTHFKEQFIFAALTETFNNSYVKVKNNYGTFKILKKISGLCFSVSLMRIFSS